MISEFPGDGTEILATNQENSCKNDFILKVYVKKNLWKFGM